MKTATLEVCSPGMAMAEALAAAKSGKPKVSSDQLRHAGAAVARAHRKALGAAKGALWVTGNYPALGRTPGAVFPLRVAFRRAPRSSNVGQWCSISSWHSPLPRNHHPQLPDGVAQFRADNGKSTGYATVVGRCASKLRRVYLGCCVERSSRRKQGGVPHAAYPYWRAFQNWSFHLKRNSLAVCCLLVRRCLRKPELTPCILG